LPPASSKLEVAQARVALAVLEKQASSSTQTRQRI